MKTMAMNSSANSKELDSILSSTLNSNEKLKAMRNLRASLPEAGDLADRWQLEYARLQITVGQRLEARRNLEPLTGRGRTGSIATGAHALMSRLERENHDLSAAMRHAGSAFAAADTCCDKRLADLTTGTAYFGFAEMENARESFAKASRSSCGCKEERLINAEALHGLGSVCLWQQQYPEASEIFTRLLSTACAEAEADPKEPRWRAIQTEAYDGLRSVDVAYGRLREALSHAREAYRCSVRRLALDRSSLDAVSATANSQLHLSRRMSALEQPRAEATARKGLSMYHKVMLADPTPMNSRWYALAHRDVAEILTADGESRSDSAKALLDTGLNILTNLRAATPDHPWLCYLSAGLLEARGDLQSDSAPQAAVSDYDAALDLLRSLPKFTGGLDRAAGVMVMRGDALNVAGRREDAEAAYEAAMSMQKELLSQRPHDSFRIYKSTFPQTRLASLLVNEDSARAVKLAAPAVTAMRKVVMSDRQPFYVGRLANCLQRLADTEADVSSLAKAVKLQGESISLYEELARSVGGPWVDCQSYGYRRMADWYKALGRSKAAKKAADKSLDIARRLADRKDTYGNRSEVASSLSTLADIQHRLMGNALAAGASYGEAAAIYAKLVNEYPHKISARRWFFYKLVGMADTIRDTAGTRSALGCYRVALSHLQRLIEISDTLPHKRDLGLIYERIALSYIAMQESESAVHYAELALELCREVVERSGGSSTFWLADLTLRLDHLGILKLEQGDATAAAKLFAESKALLERLIALEKDNVDWTRQWVLVTQRLAEASEKCDCLFGDPKELRRKSCEVISRMEARGVQLEELCP